MHKLRWIGTIALAAVLMAGVVNLGQMTGGEQPIVLTATLTATQEVPAPAGNTPATAGGSATLLFDPSDNTLQFALAYGGLSGGLTLAHFHGAQPGSAGGVVQTVCGAPAPAIAGDCGGDSGFLQGTWDVPADQVEALLSGQLYLNLHTELNQAGEIRGQVIPR